MIELFKALAYRLQWLRWPALLICIGFGALFAYAALTDNAPDSFFTSGLTGMCWGLLVFVFVSVFPQVPAAAIADHSRWQRFILALRRFYYGVLALLTVAGTLAVIWLTFKLL